MASLNPKTSVLGKRLAAHLLRRTCFNYTKQRVDELASKTPEQALNELMASPPPLQFDEPYDPKTERPWINTPETICAPDDTDCVSPPFHKRIFVMGHWFNELIHDTTMNMKMAFFLHTNFATSWFDAYYNENLFDHHLLLRQFALGNFKTLTKKITLDNFMLVYLNNNQNSKGGPNENYARELLELFTLGKEPQIYTEEDVKQAARVLTGFTTALRQPEYIDADTGLYAGRAAPNLHDGGSKQFSEAFGGQVIGDTLPPENELTAEDMYNELDDFLDMIFDKLEVAKHICRKLYRHFVHADINDEIETDIIEPLANLFKNSNYELAAVMETLLKSQHFYNEDDYGNTTQIIGGMIKSPLEILAHTIKFFNVQLPNQQTDSSTFYTTFSLSFLYGTFFDITGFMLNAPDTVASYPAYHQSPQWDCSWFISSTIIPRYKVGQMFVTDRKVLNGGIVGAQLDSIAYIKNQLNISDAEDANLVVEEMMEYLFPEYPSPDRVDYFLNDIFLEGLSVFNWKFEWIKYMESGNDSDVRIPTDALIIALLGTPEFQLM